MKLNRTGPFFDREYYNKENKNWEMIENNFGNMVENISEEAFSKVVDSAKLNWNEPVADFASLPSEASEGDTIMVRDTGLVYRFDGNMWNEIQQIDATPINEVDERLSSQLADMATKWRHKKGLALGDSITWQDGQPYSGTGEIARGYLTLIKAEKELTDYANYGQSGKPMSGSDLGATNVIGKTIDYTDVDFVTIFAGTNDFKLNKIIGPLGEMGDSDFNTDYFIGAYRSLIEYILTQKPTIKIFLFTPLQRDNGGYDVNYVNPANHRLIDYVEAVKKVGALYSIPVLDLYSVSGITQKTLNLYTIDGLHPNDAGYEQITSVISPFLEHGSFTTNIEIHSKKVRKGVVVYDSFDRQDASMLGTPDISPDNQPWQIFKGNWQIVNNRAKTLSTTSTDYAVVDSYISDKCEISTTVSVSGVDMRLAFRAIDYLNMFIINVNSSNLYELSLSNQGSGSILTTGTTQAAAGQTIKIKLTGSRIDFYVDGTLDFSYNSSVHLNGTKHGIGSRYSDEGEFDEFQVVAI